MAGIHKTYKRSLVDCGHRLEPIRLMLFSPSKRAFSPKTTVFWDVWWKFPDVSEVLDLSTINRLDDGSRKHL
jgi:hypothetical protein